MNIPPLGGGAATATKHLLEELTKSKELSVTLLTSAVGKYKEENMSNNVKIISLNIWKRG